VQRGRRTRRSSENWLSGKQDRRVRSQRLDERVESAVADRLPQSILEREHARLCRGGIDHLRYSRLREARCARDNESGKEKSHNEDDDRVAANRRCTQRVTQNVRELSEPHENFGRAVNARAKGMSRRANNR
jgi:hypothetical protein